MLYLRGYCGQALVLGIAGDAPVSDAVGLLARLGLYVHQIVLPIDVQDAACNAILAAALRYVCVAPQPFALQASEVTASLTHVEVPAAVRRLLGHADGSEITEEDMLQFADAHVHDYAPVHLHPWLASPTAHRAVVPQTLAYNDLQRAVSDILSSHEPGTPSVHAWLATHADSTRVICAAQLSLAHNAQLNLSGVPAAQPRSQPPPRATAANQASSSASTPTVDAVPVHAGAPGMTAMQTATLRARQHLGHHA